MFQEEKTRSPDLDSRQGHKDLEYYSTVLEIEIPIKASNNVLNATIFIKWLTKIDKGSKLKWKRPFYFYKNN